MAELDDRPAAHDIDLDALVTRTEGMTPAAIAKIVDSAALEVFREATQTGQLLELDASHLLAAIERYGGEDRPTVEHWSWDSLILPDEIKAQLQQLQAVIEDPESARLLRRRPTDGSPPCRPSRHRQDDRREGSGGTGAGVLLSDLGSRRDQQVGR